MNTSAIAQTLPCLTECALATQAKWIVAALFAMTIAGLEAWLRFPIQPLFDGYLQSAMSRISSFIASAIHHRSL